MMVAILKPDVSYKEYNLIADTFQNMYQNITGVTLPIIEEDDGASDLFVIGNDGVNDFLMNEVLDLNIKSLGIRYGTDDYCIKSHNKGKRKIVILAGGRVRSTYYAVYDYFERYADCHYFWDADVIPHSDSLPMENIDINESPRFFYRGLRYFAHRGLKRFQAEHWSFEDWKRELDWMIKKRLNFFMLRIGMDDIWQRAFPEDVPYPEDFRTIEGEEASAYNDRSDFWTLKYKGELKIKVLEYARQLDLIYPVDCGTMTHWYSRTPVEFLENKKPVFATQETKHYNDIDTGKVFDFTKKRNMDYYMRLTETMVNEHEKSSALFHTIGLGEREMFKDKDKNFALKQIAYRRIAENIRQRYPDSKLMLASWDFCGFWEPQEVAELFCELDPERTILLDYTSDMDNPDHSFLNWDVVGKFPWIFGMFHAYESESELRGPYNRTDERLKTAKDDPYCKGMILWPELSHSDPLVLEYLADNSWSPLQNNIEQIAENFSKNRYGKNAAVMNECWQKMLPFIKLGEWGGEGHCHPKECEERGLCSSWYLHRDMWSNLIFFINSPDSKNLSLKNYYLEKIKATLPLMKDTIATINNLAKINDKVNNELILRDSIDIVRTVLGRFLNFIIIKALCSLQDKSKLKNLKTAYIDLLNIMSEALSLNDDFSIYQTLKGLEAVAPTNPNFEITLKRNICNGYCSQAALELVNEMFIPEGEVVFDALIGLNDDTLPNLSRERTMIFERFMEKLLNDMQTSYKCNAKDVFLKAKNKIESLIGVIFDE